MPKQPTKDELQASIDEITAQQKALREKKRQLVRQQKATPRFEVGAVYRDEHEDYLVFLGVDSRGVHIFNYKSNGYLSLTALHRKDGSPYLDTLTKVADPDERNLHKVLHGFKEGE